MKHPNLACLSALILLLAPSAGWPFAIPKWSFSELVDKSDLIIIGEVVDDAAKGPESELAVGYATVRVTETLKGKPAETILVMYRTGIAEESVPCCRTGRCYMMLLKRGPGFYYATHGPQGVYELAPDAK